MSRHIDIEIFNIIYIWNTQNFYFLCSLLLWQAGVVPFGMVIGPRPGRDALPPALLWVPQKGEAALSCRKHRQKYVYKKHPGSSPAVLLRVCGDFRWARFAAGAAPSILSALRRQVPGETGDPTILSSPPLTGAGAGCRASGWFGGFQCSSRAPLSLWGDRGNRHVAGCSWGGGTGAACNPSCPLFKLRQVPNEQRLARKAFYFLSGQQGLLFPVQKSWGEVGKRPCPTSSHTGIGRNTVGGGE